jgi:uncharacterized protein YndB with AHSA1/START domain
MSNDRGSDVNASLHSNGTTGVIRMQAHYDASADDVWSAITDPQHLARWYGRVEGELRAGGAFTAFVYGSEWDGRGRIDSCDALREFSLTQSEEDGPHVSVRARVLPEGERTTLDVEVSGLPLDMLFAFGAGWHTHLDKLGDFLSGRDDSDSPSTWLERWEELAPSYREKTVTAIDE